MQFFMESEETHILNKFRSILIHVANYIFYLVSAFPCVKLIYDKNPSTNNISIIPGLCCYSIGALYFGYYTFTQKGMSSYLFILNLSLDIIQILLTLIWICIYLWYSSLRQVKKMINRCFLLLGVGVDIVFIGLILNNRYQKISEIRKRINICAILPNTLIFFSSFQFDICTKKKHESINILASVVGIFYSALRIYLGILIDEFPENISLLIPNVIGFIVCSFFTIFYFYLKKTKKYEHTKVEYSE